jgi:hypothetical protein
MVLVQGTKVVEKYVKRGAVLQEIMCSMCSGCQEDFLSDGASHRLIISDGVGSSWKRGSELLSQWSGVGQSGRIGGRVFLLGYSTAHNKTSH